MVIRNSAGKYKISFHCRKEEAPSGIKDILVQTSKCLFLENSICTGFELTGVGGLNPPTSTSQTHYFNNKRTECGPSQFGSSRERIAAANAANVQYAGQQRVIIITRQPTLGSRTETS